MDKIIAIIAGITLLIIGLVQILRDIKFIQKKMEFAHEFHTKLGEYLKSQGKGFQTYSWLIQKSPKLQREMGFHGILASYSPPFSNYTINNYPIILNFIPEIRKEFDDVSPIGDRRFLREYAAALNESILRYVGDLSEDLEIAQKKIRNPVTWLTEGVSWILLLPFSILNSIGLMSETIINGIANNPLFKIVAGIVTLLGFLSTVMTIVIGWNSFLQFLKTFLP
jgi:hypothetical protein